jgi:cytochrome subunit of sulfide dehydrogenase
VDHRDKSRPQRPGHPKSGRPAGSDGRRLIAGLLWIAFLALLRPASATSLIENCIDCHGTDGIAAEDDMPHLNGQHGYLLVDMMNAYRDGKRPPKVRIHREIRAENVEPIAAYYARQKAQRPKQTVIAELVAKGEALHWKHCADCHMDSGRDSDKNAPLTAAQNLDYLIAQARAFKSGARALPATTERTFRELNEDDLVAISHFYAAQDQQAPKQERRRRR